MKNEFIERLENAIKTINRAYSDGFKNGFISGIKKAISIYNELHPETPIVEPEPKKEVNEVSVIPFDYDRWKKGDYLRVVTRDGREVERRVITYVVERISDGLIGVTEDKSEINIDKYRQLGIIEREQNPDGTWKIISTTLK